MVYNYLKYRALVWRFSQVCRDLEVSPYRHGECKFSLANADSKSLATLMSTKLKKKIDKYLQTYVGLNPLLRDYKLRGLNLNRLRT